MRTPWKWTPAFRKGLQQRLREAGVYRGKIDGDIGPGSRKAIAALSAAGQSSRQETGPGAAPQGAPTEAVKPSAAAPEARAHECDRLAAHPHDEEAVAPGVTYAELDAPAVITACQAAVRPMVSLAGANW